MKKFIPTGKKPNTIRTINQFSEFQLKEKNSIFIGNAYPANNPEDFEKILNDVRKKFYDANHQCFAYKLLDNVFRYSDAGEPSGTAGIRIYNAIEHFDLVEILVIVIRYFGGTKLGVGPLGKAYYNTALKTLENAAIIEKDKHSKLRLTYSYENTSKIHQLLNKYNASEIENIFKESPIIEFYILFEKRNNFEDELNNSLKGNIQYSVIIDSVFL